MVGVSAVIAIALGLSLALVLTVTASGGLYPKPRLNRALSITVNTFRAIPFIILLIAMLPFTRLLVGTTLGTWAAIVPLSANLVPFFARIAQVSLNDVDPGLVEAARAMGCRRLHIVRHVLLPEALPGIIGGMTVSVIAMINASAMAGAVGAGGLGDLAIRYGYERYETRVMFEVIVILIALVSIVQFTGEWLSRRADHSADAAMRRRMSGQGGRQQAGQLLRAQLVLFADQGVDAGLVLPIARQVVVALEQQLSAARDPVGAVVVEQRDHLAEFVEDARFQVPGPVHVAQPRGRCAATPSSMRVLASSSMSSARISAGMSSSACWLRWR